MKMRRMFLSMLGVVCLVLTCGILVGCDQKENAQIQFEKESVEIEVDETAIISFTTTVEKPLLEVTIEQGKVDCEIQENEIKITGISEGQDVVTLTLHKDLVKTSATLNVVVKAKTISEPDDNDKQQGEQPSESTDPTEPKDEQDVDKGNPTDPSESTNPTNPEGETPEENEGGNNPDEKGDQGGNGDDQDLNDSKENPNEQVKPVEPTPDESKDGQDTEKENPTDPGETNPSESTNPADPDENDKGDVENQPDDKKDKEQEDGDPTKPTDPTNPDENKPTEPDVVEDKTDKYTADDLDVKLTITPKKQVTVDGRTIILKDPDNNKTHLMTILAHLREDNSIDVIFEGCSIYVDGELSGEFINEDEKLSIIIEDYCKFSLELGVEFDMILKFSVTDAEGTFYVDVPYHVIVE